MFLTPAVEKLTEAQATIRLRASGRAGGVGIRASSAPRGRDDDDSPRTWRRDASRERAVHMDEMSQDVPAFVQGERVKHKTFGSGTISAMAGAGRDAKVTVDFDDENIGRKRLVVAFAGLERGFD
jgi:DNA helicase-2/ATP-dependent DNA helicase PcrA